MPSRRSFINNLTCAGIMAAAPTASSLAFSAAPRKVTNTTKIKSLVLRDETIVRYPTINGDNWHMTWTADDRQYAGLCDGYFNQSESPKFYNSRLISVEGAPEAATFSDVLGYPELAQASGTLPRYYNFGIVSFDKRIYQFLSTWSGPGMNGLRFIGVKAIYSSDGGRTWHNQDGSTPVVWQDWDNRSRDRTMLFLEEPQDAFSIISVLQMGQDYSDNRDGYIYMYAPNGNSEGTMNQLVMLRVAKDQILNRKSYEYFAGLSARGGARWSAILKDRAVVHTFPEGWVNKAAHPWAWIPSVSYNAPLGLYMMANWATAPGPAPKEEWFKGPSYLGFWISPNPWGPWTQVYENRSWTPGGDPAARCYSPVIAPKWIAKDGKSFWLVWTDYQEILNEEEYQEIRSREIIKKLDLATKAHTYARLFKFVRPYYCINIQRVDVT